MTKNNFMSDIRVWKRLYPTGEVYTPRTGHTVATMNDQIYVFGGTDRRRRQQDLYQLDVQTSTWSQVVARGALPPRRSGALGVTYDNKLFLFGGYDGRDGNYYNDLFYFDFTRNQWDEMPSTITSRPEARTDHIMVLHQASIYIFGGYNGSSRFSDLAQYNIEKKCWCQIVPKGSVPSRRFGHSGVSHTNSNRLIVFGGWDGRDTLNDTYAFDYNTQTWELLRTNGIPPPHRYRHTAVIYGDNMFVFGGVDKTHARFNDLQCLNLRTNTWSEIITTGTIPSSRTFHRAITVNNQMYLLGGYDGTDRLQDLFSIDVGPLTPSPLLQLCAQTIRLQLDSVLASGSTFKNVPAEIANYVVFSRDGDSCLRGKCKVCRPGRCSVYQVQAKPQRRLRIHMADTEDNQAQEQQSNVTTISSMHQKDRRIAPSITTSVCACGHSNFHHDLIDEEKLYGKQKVVPKSTSTISSSNKGVILHPWFPRKLLNYMLLIDFLHRLLVLLLCGSIYKRLFDSSSLSPTSTLISPRSTFSDPETDETSTECHS